MPMYTISSVAPIQTAKRQPLAEMIMDVHCDLTGAPQTFVQVVLSFGVPLDNAHAIQIFGNVRKGRTAEANETLRRKLKESAADLLKLSPSKIEVALSEVPASWVMEGGEVLPEPGEEDECSWLQEQK